MTGEESNLESSEYISKKLNEPKFSIKPNQNGNSKDLSDGNNSKII